MAEVMLRVGLLGTAFVTWRVASGLWETGNTVTDAASLVLMLGAYMAAFGLFVAGLARPVPAAARFAIPVVLVALFLAQWHVDTLSNRVNGIWGTTDVRLYMDYAARLIRHGRNPYAEDLSASFELNTASMNFGTPLVDGDFTGRMAYPALAVLVFVPFQWLGLDAQAVYPTFFLVLLAVMYLGSPATWRPVVLLPWFVEPRYVLYTLGGVSDHVWALLLVLVVIAWERPVARAVLYGLACSYKHQPWLLAPFLLIRVWHETEPRARPRRIAEAVAIGGATFLAVNLPFLLADPGAWARGALEPVVAEMITLGQGISALTVVGWAMIPKPLYTLYMLSVLGLLVLVYARHVGRLRELIWMAPGIVLWFGNRSLSSYWYYSAFPLVMALVRIQPGPRLPQARSWWPDLAASGAVVAFVVGSVGWFSAHPPPLAIHVEPRMELLGGRVAGLDVVVENHGDRSISPRFAVQSRADQPFFWRIDRGPWTLRPGEQARFELSSSIPHEAFDPRWGARVAVSDAADPGLRAVAMIEPELGHASPGEVPNGSFRIWDTGPDRPSYWGLAYPPEVATLGVEADPIVGTAMVAEVVPGEAPRGVFVDTYIVLPWRPIEVTVQVPEEANRGAAPDVRYGLRLILDEQPFLVLFDDEPRTGVVDDVPYVALPVERGRWEKVVFDVATVAAQVGIEPSPIRRHGPGIPALEARLDFPLSALNLQLMVETERPEGLTARFGPIRTTDGGPDLEERFERQLREPAPLLTWLGDHAFEARNLDTAIRRYDAALAAAPRFGPAWYRLGEASFWAGHDADAVDAWRHAIALDHEVGSSWKGIAWCLMRAGRAEDAEIAFLRSLDAYRVRASGRDRLHRADAYKGLALATAEQDRCAEAMAWLEIGRGLAPIDVGDWACGAAAADAGGP